MGIITAHRGVAEFRCRPVIAGLQVLNGVLGVRNSIENASPANARTVLAALRTLVDTENVYASGLHTSDFFHIRNLIKELEPISAVSGVEGGDDATAVAARVRTALNNDAVIVAKFIVGGSGANVTLTLRDTNGAANDATLNIAYASYPGSGLTDDSSSVDTTSGVLGVAQVETATAAGSVSGDGNAAVVITGAGITGSPITLAVAVLNGDTPTVWAAKVRAAIAANAAISALYSVGGSTTAIVLTRITPAANDATLNIALATGTATGITTAATSADTTAGVAPVQQVETQTIVGSVVLDGQMTITVTSAGMTGSPRTVQANLQGSMGTDVILTDALYAAAKASSDPAEQALRASLVTIQQDFTPGFTGTNLSNGGRF